MKLLIATHNKAKLEDLKRCIDSMHLPGFEIVTLSDLGITQDAPEDGETFFEVVNHKARFYAGLTGLPTIADDGGMMIDVLNGEPGVKSKRWMGRDATDEELINYTMKRLEGHTGIERSARMQTCICFFDPKTKSSICEEEHVKGYIALKPSGKETYGFPYRAVFMVGAFNKYYDELTHLEHEKENHRWKALKRLLRKVYTSYKT